MDQLIQQANVILLVKINNIKKGNHRQQIAEFEILETLKGNLQNKSINIKRSSKYIDNDFKNHNATIFWKPYQGRSPWLNGPCYPEHSFIVGQTYLIFPKHMANKKSAEVINSNEDRWLKYVKIRIHENRKNP